MMSFRKLPRLLLAALAGLFFVANADYSQAQVIFDNGAENIVDTPQPLYIVVRDSGMGDPTTALIQDGAVIPENNPDDDQSIIVEDNSIVEMSGGLTDGHFDTFDTSMGLFTGGIVGDEVRAFGNSMITIGTPMMMAQVLDIEDDLFADENGFIEMYEGRVFDDAEIFGNSRLIIYGGEVDEDVEAFDNSEITIFGGLFNTGFSDPDDIEGASISTENSDDGVPNTAQINVRGGTFVGALFDPDFEAYGNGTIKIFGTDFAVDGSPVPFGPLAAMSGQLTGTLADGSALDNDFSRMDSGGQVGIGEIILVLLGDVNQDGEVTLLDVDPFVTLLTSGKFLCEADINGDGIVSLLDVNPFVALLTGG